MKDSLAARLADLREQFASGQNVMTELSRKQDELRSTLLRISGAIQVLEEILAEAPAPKPASSPASPDGPPL
jgi:ABC-type transporter Mla subunit MlaD